MTKRAACLLVVLGALPWAAWAQVPAGPEFRVNRFTPTRQGAPSVALDASGNFVVAWSSLGQDGSGYDVFVRRFGGLHPAALAVVTKATSNADGNGVP